MNSSGSKLTVEPPHYALDGSRGYFLYVTGMRRALGWIYAEDDGTVYATLDRAPWQQVGTVAERAELSPSWIAEHRAAILRPF